VSADAAGGAAPGEGAKGWLRAALALKVLAAANLFAMMAVATVDVFGRYVLNAPLPGAFEITEVMMAVLVFSVLPIVTASDDHLTIGLLESRFRGRLRHAKTSLVSLISLAFVATAAWRVWIEAGRMADIQERTAYLGIWLWPLAYFMFAMLALTIGALIYVAFSNARAALSRTGP
jgi:TRAP-type C4-dicarboxylate transport system permease small subunit